MTKQIYCESKILVRNVLPTVYTLRKKQPTTYKNGLLVVEELGASHEYVSWSWVGRDFMGYFLLKVY